MKKKPDILLIGDVDNWAFAQIINWISQNLNQEYNIFYDYMIFNGWDRTIDWAQPKLKFKDCFIKPFFCAKRVLLWYRRFGYKSRKVKFGIKPKYDIVVFLDFYMDRKANFNFSTKHIIRGIFTDVFPPWGLVYDRNLHKKVKDLNKMEFFEEYFSDTDALLLGSPFLENFYKANFPNVFFANMTYDKNIFKPTQKNNGEKLIIGWTGNPNSPWKGFYEIIEPAVKKAQKKYPQIQLKTRFTGPIETLHQFYNNVDLICIASDGDAGPFLFTEASLSGIPSISTKIGLPSYVIEENKNGLFVERNIEEFYNKIIYLYENKDVLLEMKKRIRKDYLAKLGSVEMKKKWNDLFQFVLNEKK